MMGRGHKGQGPLRASSPSVASRRPGEGGTGRRVLVVDAQEAFRRKACRVFQDLGHEALACRDLREVGGLKAAKLPDLVVIELGLPSRSGEEMHRRMRSEERSSHVPFLFLCRGSVPGEIQRGIPIDLTAVLKKPFTYQQLAECSAPLLARLDRIEQFGRSRQYAGSFINIDLYDLLGAVERYRRTGTLALSSPEASAPALLDFLEGRLVQARCGVVRGREVFTDLMLWPQARYTFNPGCPEGLDGGARVSREEWRELTSYVNLVDHGRMNPFPLSRTGWEAGNEDEVGQREGSVIMLLREAASAGVREDSVIDLLPDAMSFAEGPRDESVIDLLPDAAQDSRDPRDDSVMTLLCDAVSTTVRDESVIELLPVAVNSANPRGDRDVRESFPGGMRGGMPEWKAVVGPRDDSVIELLEVAPGRGEREAAGEPLADGPPPARWEDEDPELEGLLTDAWSSLVSAPGVKLPELPGLTEISPGSGPKR